LSSKVVTEAPPVEFGCAGRRGRHHLDAEHTERRIERQAEITEQLQDLIVGPTHGATSHSIAVLEELLNARQQVKLAIIRRILR
jgi:hypothetical protein